MVVGFLTERSDGCTGTVSTLAAPYSQNESDNATHYKKATHTCDTDSPTTRCVIEGSLDAYTENTHAGPKEREAKGGCHAATYAAESWCVHDNRVPVRVDVPVGCDDDRAVDQLSSRFARPEPRPCQKAAVTILIVRLKQVDVHHVGGDDAEGNVHALRPEGPLAHPLDHIADAEASAEAFPNTAYPDP